MLKSFTGEFEDGTIVDNVVINPDEYIVSWEEDGVIVEYPFDDFTNYDATFYFFRLEDKPLAIRPV